MSSNEQVLDSDLRQANRVNLELALLHNVSTGAGDKHLASAHQQGVPSLRRPLRTKSLSGNGGCLGAGPVLLHHHHQHFPQSGFLVPASEDRFQQQMSLEEQRQAQVALSREHQVGQISSQSSKDDDSGVSGTSTSTTTTWMDQSRRSSCVSGALSSPLSGVGGPSFGRNEITTGGPRDEQAARGLLRLPTVRVEITKRRLLSVDENSSPSKQQADCDGSCTRSGHISGIFHSLASSLGRSASSDLHAIREQEDQREIYQINIIEARNVLRQGQQLQLLQASRSPRTGSRNRANRRESFFGALVAAATSSNQQGAHKASDSPGGKRKVSADSCVFVRIFKQRTVTQNTGSIRGQSLQRLDSSPSEGLQAQSSSFLQLPQVSIASSSVEPKYDSQSESEQQDEPRCVNVNFSKLAPGGYSFTCRREEFPLRLSVYLASGKRGQGARYTLGHCVISLDDFQDKCERGRSGSDESGENKTTMFWPPVGCKFVGRPGAVMSASIDEEVEDEGDTGKWLVEYRLHGTLLEAIRSTA